jgi:hypothetical protein
MSDRNRVHYSPRNGGLWVSADWAQASSAIKVSWHKPGNHPDGDDDWQSTPFQVADARHSPREAARLVSDWGKSQG